MLRIAELFGATGFVVLEPILSILRQGSPYLVRFRLRRVGLVFAVLVIACTPALALWACEELLAVIGVPQHVSHLTILALLAGVFVSSLVKQRGGGARRRAAVAAIGAAAAGAVFAMWPATAHVFLALAVVPVAVGAHFVLSLQGRVCMTRRVAMGTTANDASAGAPRIVLVVFDEFPETSLLDGEGRIDRALFPNFARLADESTWYRNTSTQSVSTRRAVTSILTGKYITEGTLPTFRDHPENVFSVLQPTHELNVHETVTRLSPELPHDHLSSGWWPLVRESFRLWVNYVDVRRTQSAWFGDYWLFRDTMALGEHFVDSLQASSRPVFDFLHALMPHRPWHYLGTGQDYVDSSSGWGGARWTTRQAREAARQRHLLQVQATDWLLGKIIDRLVALGSYSDCLLAVTSDHGVSVASDVGVRTPTQDSYPDVLWVPFLVKAPGQSQGRIDDTALRTIDVLPTILDVAGIDAPYRFNGAPAGAARPPESPVGLMIFSSDDRSPAAIDASWRRSFEARPGFDRVLQSCASTSPTEHPEYGLFGIGPCRDFVGREIADFVLSADSVEGEIHKAERFTNISDPSARHAPWLVVSGRVASAESASVVVGVNGRIAGTGELRPAGAARSTFSAIVVPAFFAAGYNDVRVYLVGEGDATLDLSLIAVHGKARGGSRSALRPGTVPPS